MKSPREGGRVEVERVREFQADHRTRCRRFIIWYRRGARDRCVPVTGNELEVEARVLNIWVFIYVLSRCRYMGA